MLDNGKNRRTNTQFNGSPKDKNCFQLKTRSNDKLTGDLFFGLVNLSLGCPSFFWRITMPSQQVLKSVGHNIAHHAQSGLSYVHPYLGQLCREAGVMSIEVELLDALPYPVGFPLMRPLELALALNYRRHSGESWSPQGFLVLQCDPFGCDSCLTLFVRMTILVSLIA